MIDNKNYRRMASEVLKILSIYPEDIRKKIPTSLIAEFEKNKLPDLNVNLDKNKKLYEQDICDETLVMMYIIYRNYIAEPQEKEKFDKILNEFDEEIRKKYDTNNLFKKDN